MCFWWLKTLFWSSRLKTHVFEKHLNLVSCISFMKSIDLSVLCIKLLLFFKISIFLEFRLIEILENWIFRKTVEDYAKTTQPKIISWLKCMRMSLKVFQKHLFSTQNFKNKIFNHQKRNFCQPLNIFCIKHHRKHNLGWPNQIHTQFHVLSLAKNNLWSMCN